MSEKAPRLVGRYAIHGEIASGGMATVHLGRQLGPLGFSKTVAVKRLHEQFAKDEEFVAMFIDEARLAARIHHPNVVQTLDVVQADDQLLLIMEYVHGVQLSTLTRLARKGGRKVPPAIACAIVSGMLRGLHAAHDATDEQGRPLDIVHRDVSPHNVLVGVDGVPRVIDFGVAKAAGRLQQTATGQLKGKIPYMAPEQVRGQPVSRRTDVWAAGVVLWETLLSQRLFHADNDAAIIAEIVGRNIDPPSRVDLEVPAALDDVVMRALERDPERRFPTARAMAEALEARGRIAHPAEVSEWVQQTAADVLQKRATLVTDVESTSAIRAVSPEAARELLPDKAAASQVSSVSVTVPEEHAPKRRVSLITAMVALVVFAAVGFGIGRALWSDEAPRTSASRKIEGLPAPEPSASAAPVASPSVEPSASATAIVAPPKPKPKPTAIAAPPAPTTPHDHCDPPYTFDAKGMKKYKPQCL